MMRGEGIPDVVCAPATASVPYTRGFIDPALRWSVGGDPTTNVIGHTFVVHDRDDLTAAVVCAEIKRVRAL